MPTASSACLKGSPQPEPASTKAAPWQRFSKRVKQVTSILPFSQTSVHQIIQRRCMATGNKDVSHDVSDPSHTDVAFVPIRKYFAPPPVPGPPISYFKSWLDPTAFPPPHLSAVDKLRLRSAFITWNTSEAQIRMIKMLDWRKLQIAISLRGEVTRKWYRVGHFSNLLNHIKSRYNFERDLEKFEDLTALKYACARLSLRSRAIYLHLLHQSPKVKQDSAWLKRCIALQAENVRRLSVLIEPFYNEWASTGNATGTSKSLDKRRATDFRTFLEGRATDFRSLAPDRRPIDLSDATLSDNGPVKSGDNKPSSGC
jgi:hypothetical protein